MSERRVSRIIVPIMVVGVIIAVTMAGIRVFIIIPNAIVTYDSYHTMPAVMIAMAMAGRRVFIIVSIMVVVAVLDERKS